MAAATNSTAKITPRIVYCWPTRTAPTPTTRRFGPSATVVGPGAGLIRALGTALGTTRGPCGAGAAPFFTVAVLVGSLRNAIVPPVILGCRGCALRAHVKKILVRHKGAYVQFVPHAAFLVAKRAGDPGPRNSFLHRLHCLHVLQAEHPANHQSAEALEALRDQQQAAIRRARRRLASGKGREIHHAREHSANIRQPEVPRPGKRNSGNLREREHLARVVQLEQPAAVAGLNAQPRGRLGLGLSLAQSLGEPLLELAKADLFCHR